MHLFFGSVFYWKFLSKGKIFRSVHRLTPLRYVRRFTSLKNLPIVFTSHLMFSFFDSEKHNAYGIIGCRGISISSAVSQGKPSADDMLKPLQDNTTHLFWFLTYTQCSCCSKSLGFVLLSISRFSVSFPKGNPRHLDRSLRSSLRQSTCENACPQPTRPFGLRCIWLIINKLSVIVLIVVYNSLVNIFQDISEQSRVLLVLRVLRFLRKK